MINRGISYLRQFDKNLWILCGGWFVSAVGFAASIPFIAIYFNETYGLSMTQVGILFGILAVVRAVFQLVGGEFSDRIERKYLLIYSQFGRMGAFFLMALGIAYNWGLWWIGGFLLIQSIFGAVFQPAANAMVADILPPEKRLDGYALTRSAGNLGWAAGPALGGFLAKSSYAALFHLSAALTLLSGLIFLIFLTGTTARKVSDRFTWKDLLAIKDDPNLARHSILIFILYLVVAQLIAPFSLFAVQMVGISEHELGYLFALNGLLVFVLQMPVTRMLKKWRLTSQLATGALLYLIGYTSIGVFPELNFFALSITIVTVGEVFMSPASLTLTSRLAPDNRMGRYMGIFGFSVASGWSFGPLYGGLFLDSFGNTPALAWGLIASAALISAVGYLMFRRRLPEAVDAGTAIEN